MSPSRRRLNCVAPSRAARCGSSSSVRSGKVASQREIESGLGIGDTPVHTPPRPEDRDGSKSPKRGTRARPVHVDMVWEQAPKKLSKCRYARATTQAQKRLLSRANRAA